MRRVVVLPERGKLIVATDLQGHVDDFERITAIFERAAREPDGAVLVVTGDLVHGPELAEMDWPDYLGSYYEGDSPALLERARELQNRYPGRVHYLLGNHEHAHVGGPIVAKFFPDEAMRLEELLGDEGTLAMRAWFRTWPFVAVAPKAQLVMLHAAPHARIQSRDDLENLSLDGCTGLTLEEMAARGTLGALLWARTTSSERAWSFLRAIHSNARVAVYGHDVARTGYAIDREPMLCVSTSFGCFDGDKMYLEWDLAESATSAEDVARRGLRLLHPGAPAVHRVAF
ncbi:metallophosphoesterase [Polyangium jinanense]|uniref:Metallophosphoesterase n=1 Tax=Polyangium jinanense TaxID=2829994 RepID=A0A9X3XFW0_9BACT|nr:metallophosphoesterase [Polyangium jinanense]MDC3958486.1 metallophosphoesterase [Polyangium jinanense]MDC3987341.1 metallophosphoesterase [Polyangium jinanense]